MEIPKNLLELIDEGYSLESAFSNLEYEGIRFYKHGSGYKKIKLQTMKILPVSVRRFDVCLKPEDIMDSNISFQFLYFVLEKINSERFNIINWIGWSEDKFLQIFINENLHRIYFYEYEESEFVKIKYDKFLPDILRPVSGIIQSYAHMPFYDFLMAKFKEYGNYEL